MIDRIGKMVEVLKSYAPDENAAAKVDGHVQAMMEDDELTNDIIVFHLAGMLIDGLRGGNWIWRM